MAFVLDTIQEKYIALIPNYNLKIKNYKEKHNLLNVSHPSCQVKPVF